MLLGGDFNSTPKEIDTLMLAQGQPVTGWSRLPLPDGSSTGLSSDFSKRECIDHMLLPVGVVAERGSVVLEKDPCSPYSPVKAGHSTGPADVVGASDHIWISARFRLCSTR